MNIMTEGKAKIIVETQEVVDKKMPVFYNPVMKTNRDFSILVIGAMNKKDLTIIDPLAGSGIRILRILKEIEEEKINQIITNDIKPKFTETIKENLQINQINTNKLTIKNEDANKVMNSEGHYDYIEIDPFGTPNPFLDTAIRTLKRNAILSVTATDTSSLCGSFPLACKRKYWAEPLRNELMHEFAVRILIRKIQLLGAQHEKALTPLLSYATDHYIKIFFESKNSKTLTDQVLKKHEYYEHEKQKKGPIWIGEIQNEEYLKKMNELSNKIEISKKTKKILETLQQESQIKTTFFIDIHELASKLKLNTIPKLDPIIQELKKNNYDATRTHFRDTAIKTNANEEIITQIIEKININK